MSSYYSNASRIPPGQLPNLRGKTLKARVWRSYLRLLDGHSSRNKNVATNCTYLLLSVRSTCVLVSSPTPSGTIRCEVCHRSTSRTKYVGTYAGEGVRYKRSMKIDSYKYGFVSKFDGDSTKICSGFKKVGGGFKKVWGGFKKVWGGFKKVWGQNGCWSPLGVGNAPKSDFPSKICAKWSQNGAKICQNRPKIKQIPMPKPTSNSIPFFNRFLMKF